MFRHVLLRSIQFPGRLPAENMVINTSRRAISNISQNLPIKCQFRRDYWRKERKSHNFPSYFTTGGFSLGFLGFFGKDDDEEMSTEDTLILMLKRAILAIKRDRLDEAEEHLVNALRLSHEHKMEDVKTQIFDMQANLAFQKREFDRAEVLFKATAQRLVAQQGFPTTDNAIVEISLKLAQIYAEKGQMDEAFSGYEYCIDTQRTKIEKGGEEDEDTLMLAAWALHSFAQLRLARGSVDKKQNEEISVLINDAYKYASRATGHDSEQAISIKSDLASTMALSNDFEGALKTLKEVESIARDKHQDLYPHIKVNIGNVYLQKGSFIEAERVCVDARTFAKKVNNLEAFARAEECLLSTSKAKTHAVA